MEFDRSGFLKTKFQRRTKEVEVPELKDERWWIAGDSALQEDSALPVFTCQGLEGIELAQVREGATQDQTINAVLTALTEKGNKLLISELRERFGTEPKTPSEAIQIRKTLELGLVQPHCDRELAVEIYRRFPIVAHRLWQVIQQLTDKGLEAEKKAQSSSQTLTSAA